MKIVHTADWHLGRRLGRIDRTEDLRRAVQQVADVCQRENADVLLLCGDIFEQGRTEVLRFWIGQLNQIFATFLRTGGTILAITGNHDNENVVQMLQQAMMLAAPALGDLGGTIVAGRFYLFTGPTFFHLADRDGCKVQFIAMPSPTPTRYLRDESAQSYQGVDERNRALKAAYAATLNGILAHPRFDKTIPAVLAAHILTNGAVIGRDNVKLGEGEGVVVSDDELHPELAYVALGDVHKPQRLMNLDHVRYSGSIDRMDLGESSDEKGVVVVDIRTNQRDVKPRWVPIQSTPVYGVEINDPAVEIPLLEGKYPDHDRALVKLMLRYRAGQDDLNGLLSELDRIFPRWYDRDWKEVSGGENSGADAGGEANPSIHSLRQTVMGYLQTELDGDAERDAIIELAEELISQHEQG